VTFEVAGAAGSISAMALSGDGSELAVAYGTGKLVTLRVYSVATGQPQHAWSATGTNPVTDLSWVGDSVIGFSAARVGRRPNSAH
jgi:hypothetical protein